MLGLLDGATETVGCCDGVLDGDALGAVESDGLADGLAEGLLLGSELTVGELLGEELGAEEGAEETVG